MILYTEKEISDAVENYTDFHSDILSESENYQVYVNRNTFPDGRIRNFYIGIEDESGSAITGYDQQYGPKYKSCEPVNAKDCINESESLFQAIRVFEDSNGMNTGEFQNAIIGAYRLGLNPLPKLRGIMDFTTVNYCKNLNQIGQWQWEGFGLHLVVYDHGQTIELYQCGHYITLTA